ncbi:hypothetical protein, partial [Erwinia sp. V71]|uniref:hypothetical protein n=1 Tax=Erwinia sp. V71 TaxID=3369424 RepID=UPI003F6237F3
QATVCGVCRAKIGGLALHFGVESANNQGRILYANQALAKFCGLKSSHYMMGRLHCEVPSRIQIISATLGHVDGGTVSYR